MKRIVVIGGGITGLSLALDIRDASASAGSDVDIVVLEASSRPGGNIQTEHVDGFTIERGPNGYLDNAPKTLELVNRLGLGGEIQKADARAARRFIFRAGKLHLVPAGPGFLASGILSLPGRMRVLAEPLVPPRRSEGDETVFEFASRRIGREAAEILVDAMVAGVYAGNSRKLSLQSTFPKMAAMEREHGSLTRAMFARMKERRRARSNGEIAAPGGPAGPAGTLTSFRHGLDSWVDALARAVGPSLRLDSAAQSLKRNDQPGGARYLVGIADGSVLEADAVAITVPAPRAAPILAFLDEELAQSVGALKTAGLAVVALAFDEADIGGPPDGFGFLVPRGQGVRILGCLWDSSVFPGRAPPGKVLIRAMAGGAHDEEAVKLDDKALLDLVRRDLATTMNLRADPKLVRIYRHPLGIGQYELGHGQALEKIVGRLATVPGIFLAGSSFHGVSMNSCIQWSAEHAVDVLAG